MAMQKQEYDRMKWWKEVKFGMFIHWGIYSLLGRGEWAMFGEDIPFEEYKKLVDRFNPSRYNPEQWVKLAIEAGIKYIVLTTKHHDGFCLFDSKMTDYTVMKSPFRKDIVREYVNACRKFGIRIGFYYSLIDWSWPVAWQGPDKNPSGWKKLVDFVHRQIEELCTRYGKIDILWYDGAFYFEDKNATKTIPTRPEHWDAENLNKMVRNLQPEIIINNRSGLPEDFDTPENEVRPSDRPWESCITLFPNHWWGFHQGDYNYKPAWQVIQLLVDIVSKDGNLLLNVGPQPDGCCPLPVIKTLKEVGKWMREHGESIYGTTGISETRGMRNNFGRITRKNNMIYLHLFGWHGRHLTVSQFKYPIHKVYLLPAYKELKFHQQENKIFISGLPVKPPHKADSVIIIETK